MLIRRAKEQDTVQILRLLGQVLELHAALFPDVFLPGTTKYTAEELHALFADDDTPVYVAAQGDRVLGYAFCVVETPTPSNCRVPRKVFYLDDLCVDEAARSGGIGTALFRHVEQEARRLGCQAVELNVWEGNDAAKAFYARMGMRPESCHMTMTVEP